MLRDIVPSFVRRFAAMRMIRRKMRPYHILVPSHLAIETTNLCNGKCVFCPSRSMTRKRGTMDMGIFRRIIDDARDLGTVDFITHGGMGEPLLDNAISDRISIEKSRLSSRIQLHTNGSLLDGATARRLFEAGLDVLSISLNAFDKKTYETTTGLNYDRVRRNIDVAFETREKLRAETQIRMTMVRTEKMRQEEVDAFTSYWRALTPWVAVHPEKNWASYTRNTVEGDKYPCKWIWHMMSINWDGKVKLCHEDYDGKTIIGDLAENKIVDVFNCSDIKRMRKLFYDGEMPSSNICKDCSRLVLDRTWWNSANPYRLSDGAIKYSEKPPDNIR